MQTAKERNYRQLAKIDALANYDHELFDALMDAEYSLHLLDKGAEHLRKRYMVSCGQLAHLPCIEGVGLAQEAWAYIAEHE